jgi:ABC-type branched-subunit amino acid transport system substrate-binding protein
MELEEGREGLSRRVFMRRAGVGLMLVGAPSLLAACGDSGSSSTATSGTTGAASAGASSADGKALASLLGLPSGKAAGAGLTIPVGGDFALSGRSASYGVEMYRGAQMGVEHVKAAGGPEFKLTALDTTDPTTATTNVRRFGSEGMSLVLTSQGGGFSAGIPFYPQYKMLALDFGGATSFLAGKPNYYMGTPVRPDAQTAMAIAYMKAKMPEVKKFVYVNYDDSSGIGKAYQAAVKAQGEAAGYLVGFVSVPQGTTDFNPYFPKIKAQNPDLVYSATDLGTDMGLFMKQYVTSGIGKPVIGDDYTAGAAKVAGSAFDQDFYWSSQYFTPATDWGKLFAPAFKAKFGYEPNYYNANYYQGVFWMWDLARRVIAAGGDPTAKRGGDAYVKALDAKPEFASVFGTTAATTTSVFDDKTHILSKALMAFGSGKGPTLLATANVDGSDFTLAAS